MSGRGRRTDDSKSEAEYASAAGWLGQVRTLVSQATATDNGEVNTLASFGVTERGRRGTTRKLRRRFGAHGKGNHPWGIDGVHRA